MADTAGPKICIQCGDDCAGKPRTKDAQGRYTCRPCYDKKQAAAAAAPAKAAPDPTSARVAAPASTYDIDASLLKELAGEEAAPVTATPCPTCGAGMMAGAVICTTCGYNVQTKKNMRSVVERGSAPGEGGGGGGLGSSRSAAGALVALPTLLILGSVGAAIGGAVGAGIWAAVAYNLGFHMSYIAILIGVLTGAGMRAGVRGYAGGLTGALAALIAAGAVAGGHYWTVSLVVDRYVQRGPSAHAIVTDEFATAKLADAIADEHAKNGVKDAWPGGTRPEYIHEKEEYPSNVWAEAEDRWAKMSPDERSQMKRDLEAFVKDRLKDAVASVKAEGFLSSFSPFDALWFILAIFSAFRIGSGGSLGSGGS
jgi:hypothetical protein